MPAPFLSIVIPAHNEEKRLPASLDKMIAFIQAQSYAVEIVVVENGSTDKTLEISRQYASIHPELHVLHEAQAGKGLAVQRGMLAAQGEYRLICDADLSMPIEEANHFIPPYLPQVDVAIASRETPGARRYNEPFYRHWIGRIFNTMVRWLALPGLQDTQCGFKCFQHQVAEEVFSLQTLSGWSFDVEVLVIARRLGYRIVEVPINWYFIPGSRVHILRDSIRMAADLWKINRNAQNGLYEKSQASHAP